MAKQLIAANEDDDATCFIAEAFDGVKDALGTAIALCSKKVMCLIDNDVLCSSRCDGVDKALSKHGFRIAEANTSVFHVERVLQCDKKSEHQVAGGYEPLIRCRGIDANDGNVLRHLLWLGLHQGCEKFVRQHGLPDARWSDDRDHTTRLGDSAKVVESVVGEFVVGVVDDCAAELISDCADVHRDDPRVSGRERVWIRRWSEGEAGCCV